MEADAPVPTQDRPSSPAGTETLPRGRAAAALAAPAGPAILVGLIGAGIQASRTPAMHEREAAHHGLRYVYQLIDLDRLGLSVTVLDELVLAAERLGFAGLNITHPCKQAAVRLVDCLSPDADAIGAINTIVFEDDHRVGHNTDCSGFAESFRHELAEVSREHVVLVGAGGAGSAVGHALLQLGAGQVAIFDTAPSRATALAAQLGARHGRDRARAIADLGPALQAADGLVNTTPMGMAKYPGMPVAADLLRPELWVADIVYFPIRTELLRGAERRGCHVMSGAGMAIFQAAHAFALFTGRAPDTERMRQHFESAGAAPGDQSSANAV
jgi:shikimate dehydrogenase